ncbi:MAG TPA: EAL domain-containing protein [Halomonas sp.]|nr:EAL domain-containing protein [Halomonas sp.]
MAELTIESVMQPGVLVCAPEVPLQDAARRLALRGLSAIAVVEAGKVVGVWSESDSLAVDFNDPAAVRRPLAEFMHTDAICLSPTTLIRDLAGRLTAEPHRPLLVIDDAGVPLGIVTPAEVARHNDFKRCLQFRSVAAAIAEPPLILASSTALSEAIEEMERAQVEALIVDDRVLGPGVLTRRDLVGCVANSPGSAPVGHLARYPLSRIAAHEPLVRAVERLDNASVSYLAVVDAQRRIIGLLGFRDIIAGIEQGYIEELDAALEKRDHVLARSRHSLALVEQVVEASLESIVITDTRARIEYVNPSFTRVTGYTLDDVVGQTPSMLSSERHDKAFFRRMWRQLKREGVWRGEIWNRRKSGEPYLELLTISAIKDDEGQVTHYAVLFSDITDIRKNEERVRHMAYYDALTQLPNRRLLDQRLAHAIKRAKAEGHILAVLFIDLDHFKQINVSLGHARGDEILIEVATRLQRYLRDGDTLARLGGDEFIVLLPNLVDLDQVTPIVRRLIRTIGIPFGFDDQRFRIGCSVGISLCPDDGETPHQLIQRADAALNRAKRESRNAYRFYRADMRSRAPQRLALETALRNTSESGVGLSVHYQPMLSVASGRVEEVEALMRWHHPDLGDIAPGDFIALAERSGLILPLGRLLLDMVAKQWAAWRQAGLTPPRISVNLSAKQLWHQGVVNEVRLLHKRFLLPPGALGFELTESLLLDKEQQSEATLQAFIDMGCHVAIDDFGTGYSSLSYLQRLPVTTLKMDASFIQGLENPASRAILAAVAKLAQELELRLVAEGVETSAQREILRQYPVTLLQGRLIGSPVSPDDLAHRYLALA